MSSFTDAILLRPKLALKIFVGILIILTFLVYRRLQRSEMSRQIQQSLQELAALPSATEVSYLRDPAKFPGAEKLMLAIHGLGEEAVPLLFEEMERSPETRAWGLLALLQFPIPVSSGRNAPPLNLLISWLDDPDPAVSANASQYLSGIFVVLPEDAAQGPALHHLNGPVTGTTEEREARAAQHHRSYTAWVKWWYANRKFTWRAMQGAYLPEK